MSDDKESKKLAVHLDRDDELALVALQATMKETLSKDAFYYMIHC